MFSRIVSREDMMQSTSCAPFDSKESVFLGITGFHLLMETWRSHSQDDDIEFDFGLQFNLLLFLISFVLRTEQTV